MQSFSKRLTAIARFAVPWMIGSVQPIAGQGTNPPRLVGYWDFYQNRSPQVSAIVHLRADSSGGSLRIRVGGQVARPFVAARMSGDSAYLDYSPDVGIAGVLRGDTLQGHVVQRGVPVGVVRLVRRFQPTPIVQEYRLWPGPVSDSVYAVSSDSAVTMRVRDGTKLVSQVFRPMGEGPFPVVLVRTPYGRFNQTTAGRWWAARGYIFVAQDVRGRYGSDGSFRGFESQDTDGYDAVEWASALPGSNGKVGMAGHSYEATLQWYAATMQPPHLVAIVPEMASPDPWLYWPYRNGIFPLAGVAWICSVSGTTNQDTRRLDFDNGLRLLPVRRIPEALGCASNAFWVDWMRHTTLDDYWRRLAYQSRLPAVRVPVLAISGWYDDDLVGTTSNHVQLARVQAHPYQHMIIGPWGHAGRPDVLFGELGDRAWVDQRLLALRWFDRWLKDMPNGVDHEPPVTIFTMGTNAWRREREWPLARTQWTRFYLHSSGSANAASSDGTLDTVPPLSEPSDTFTYNPGDPTPHLMDAHEVDWSLNRDYSQLHPTRSDVLVYTSAPLAHDLEITGPIEVSLWAATDAVDTDWHAMLLDVDESGRAWRIQDGIVRARFREGSEREVLLQPGVPEQYRIDLWHTSHVFRAGHRIRIAIASSAFPKFGRNLNTGGDNNADSTYVSARQRVFHDRTRPSYVVLPVISY